ncbi:MAG: thioredoxin-disulfide reductase [Candidatus Omnitrophota bacterium]|jgi:thioredoxin reductase (NADPH)
MPDYDVVIIGGGPAGLTAGIYASRARLKSLLLEKMMPGGQILTSPLLENYPGFSEGVAGPGVIEEMVKQAERFGLEIKTGEVTKIGEKGDKKAVSSDTGEYGASAVIFAMGASYSKLGVPGEEKLGGRGVSYCATCDGPLYKNKEVAVVGGGDTAIEEALHLTKFCSKVYVIHRRNELRATKILQERALAEKKINIIWDSIVTEILGTSRVEGVMAKNVKTSEQKIVPVSGVFLAVGFTPHTGIAKGLVATDDKGYIITDDDMAASRAGFFAAGDCRKKLLRQFVTACGDGATAAFAAQKYIEQKGGVR